MPRPNPGPAGLPGERNHDSVKFVKFGRAVIARSGATRQSSAVSDALDCFATLAMTMVTRRPGSRIKSGMTTICGCRIMMTRSKCLEFARHERKEVMMILEPLALSLSKCAYRLTSVL